MHDAETIASARDRLYELLAELAQRSDGYRRLRECDGRMDWPNRGVYFFFEEGESRPEQSGVLRVTRVGTHAVSKGSKATLWRRLSQHKGTRDGGGNHRASVFRLLVGKAILRRDGLTCPSWGDKSQRDQRDAELAIEGAVSAVIRGMPFLVLAVDDEPRKDSERAVIERGAIALLSDLGAGRDDAPSPGWLGRHSHKASVRESGLWNDRHVGDPVDAGFLERVEEWLVRM